MADEKENAGATTDPADTDRGAWINTILKIVFLLGFGGFLWAYSSNEAFFYSWGIRIPDYVGAYLGIAAIPFIGSGLYLYLRLFLERGVRLSSLFSVESSVARPARGDAHAQEERHVEQHPYTKLLEREAKDSALVMSYRICSRLHSELFRQSNKADLNLAVGVLLAIGAAAILAWLAYENTGYVRSVARGSAVLPMLYWGAVLSKIALSITANVFAFFFLATYRRNLAEIKYFQNELTNVESKIMALCIATDHDKKLMKDVVKYLLSVERNFILRKGETTVELAQKGIDRAELDHLSNLASRAFRMAEDAKSAVSKRRSNGSESPGTAI